MRAQWKLYLLAFGLLLGLALSSPAAAQTYTPIDCPGFPATLATDIMTPARSSGSACLAPT
jgi:hypothetical protein